MPSGQIEEAGVQDSGEVEVPGSDQGSDLEYDLAHEAAVAASTAGPSRDRQQQSVYVVTETKDYSGDYGYDLAHDVPDRH
ncbi:MAG TPA: hypothetical protein VFR35_15040 [Actinoplanes sp.]|nr:hypothetical protein [Actinoplanes sp.]